MFATELVYVLNELAENWSGNIYDSKTTILWPLYRLTCVSRQPQLRTVEFC